MAYRVRRDEPIGKGLERILKKELQSAVDQVAKSNTSDEAVHEARKSIKKARAILLLAPKGSGNKADRDIQQLRGVGHLLAPLRDVDAMVKTAAELCDRFADPQQKETCASVRSILDWHRAEVEAEGQRDRIAATATAALLTLPGVKRLELKRTGFSTVVSTLEWDFKRAQRAMTLAESSNGDSDFHRWRRRVKVLWYHLRLLEVRASSGKRRADELKQLEGWLGDDHNLAVLRTQLTAESGLQGDTSAAALVAELSSRRQQELRRDALALGARIFAGRPNDAFTNLHEIWQPRTSSRAVSDVRVGDFTGEMRRSA